METAVQLAPLVGLAVALIGLGLSRATYYRRRMPRVVLVKKPPPRALSGEERQLILAALHEPRFEDLAPAQVYATLLDENRYLCSERTMYRVLAANHEVRERRDLLRHPMYSAPELLATGPNQVWSWDITKLHGPVKWNYFYLYVIVDIFSRYVVGWLVADKESSALANKLIGETIDRQQIQPGQPRSMQTAARR